MNNQLDCGFSNKAFFKLILCAVFIYFMEVMHFKLLRVTKHRCALCISFIWFLQFAVGEIF